jgi:predicted enzyme related to lactoylglutathione lyase
MDRVTGIGGIFFKAHDPKTLFAWYEKHLGIRQVFPQGTVFEWNQGQSETRPGSTIFSVFNADSDYMDPGESSFMINFRVDDLEALLKMLDAEGVKIDPKRENSEYGKFAWVYDPENNKVELWEPPRNA